MSFVQVPLFTDNDVADLERLNGIVSNTNYLNQTKTTMRYNAYGVVQTDRMRIAVGTVDANNPNGFGINRWVSVSGFFTPGTRPVGIVSWGSINQQRSSISVKRRTGESPILDHTGLASYAHYVNNAYRLAGPNYINWMMIGY